jgi:hypothetical protein
MRTACAFLTLCTLYGCATGGGKSTGDKTEENNIELYWLDQDRPENNLKLLYRGQNRIVNKPEEKNLRAACNLPEPISFSSEDVNKFNAGPILVGIAVKFAIDRIDLALTRELKKYSTAYGATADTIRFYEVSDSLTGSNFPTKKHTCFRFVRFAKAGESTPKGEPTLDLVAQLGWPRSGEYMEIKPLRFFFRDASFEKKLEPMESVGIVINVNLKAFWRQGNYGDSKVIYSGPILSLQRNIGADVLSYSNLQPLVVRTPTVPVSVDGHGQMIGPSFVDLSVSATEAGKPPKLIAGLKDILEKNKDDVAESVSDAFKKAQENTSTSSQ